MISIGLEEDAHKNAIETNRLHQEIIESMEKSSKSQKDIDETENLIDQHQTNLKELLEIKDK